MPALLVRLRPAGPWRIGPVSGARDQVDRILHSDTLYAALSVALGDLGWRDEWFAATALAGEPQVRNSSLFPWQGNLLLAPAPAHFWPHPAVRLRTSGARFIPTSVIATLAAGGDWNEDQWEVDGWSQCLLRRGRRQTTGPFRVTSRTRVAVDRLSHGHSVAHEAACLEFGEAAGLWFVVELADEQARETWQPRIEAALRLLADTGLGGERSQGWGQFAIDRVESGDLNTLILGPPAGPPETAESEEAPPENVWWLLSLFSPAAGDRVDWTRGSYQLVDRTGRIENSAGAQHKAARMVQEGSVLFASGRPRGQAPDVAPEGYPHPVYRAGFALAIPLPWRMNV